MIKINGEKFNIGIVKIERKTRIEKEKKGTTLDGKTHFEVIGTYFDYIITINTKAINISEYDRLFEVLTRPVETQIVTVPYNQNEITFNADISVGNSSLIGNFNNFKRWGELKITCQSVEPQKEVLND